MHHQSCFVCQKCILMDTNEIRFLDKMFCKGEQYLFIGGRGNNLLFSINFYMILKAEYAYKSFVSRL